MYRRYIKRLLDIIVALIGLPFLGLLTAVIAPLSYLEDRGPAFYNAPRLGKDARIFKMYKFRSMKMNAPDLRNADGSTYNSESDPRLTKLGRFLRRTSIDEIPQLLNILKGDMSLIGPRPDIPDALQVFLPGERKKLEVLPGITGYSQAYYRNEIELHERFRNDVYYAENLSFLFDCRILLRTIRTVLFHENVYRNRGDSDAAM